MESTCVQSTHRLAMLQRVDRIVGLHNGAIVLTGTTQNYLPPTRITANCARNSIPNGNSPIFAQCSKLKLILS
jgi:ABC-type bacteriocin/lantibiotic exporter with double-glycine peptidase domain